MLKKIGYLVLVCWKATSICKLLVVTITIIYHTDVRAQRYAETSGGRSDAMAGTSVAFSDAFSVLNNQAGMPWLSAPSIGVSAHNYYSILGINKLSLAFTIPVNAGALGICSRYTGYDIFSDTKFGAAYGLRLAEELSIGLQISWRRRHFEGYGSDNAVGIEGGMQYLLSEQVMMGIHIWDLIGFNPGEGGQTVSTGARFGTAWQANKKILLTAETDIDIYHPMIIRIGMEYQPRDHFFLRTGISSPQPSITVGAGYRLKNLDISFAASNHWYLGFSPTLSLQYDFLD